MSRARTKKRRGTGRVPAISLRELREVHAACKGMKPRPGSEAYSLMCVVACCMDNYPRVRAEKADEVWRRFRALARDGYGPPREAPQPSLGARPVAPPGTGPSAAESTLLSFVCELHDMPNDCAVLVMPSGAAPTGLTLGDLRALAEAALAKRPALPPE